MNPPADLERHAGVDPATAREVLALAGRPGSGTDGAFSDHQRLALEHHPEDVVAVTARSQADRRLVGYAQLVADHDALALALLVEPESPTSHAREPALVDLLLEAALAAAGAEGRPVRLWVTRPDPGWDRRCEALGLHRERDLLQLRRLLPAAPPDAMALRAFRPGLDEEGWLETNRRAFEAHPEQGRWTMEDLLAREAEPWFDPAGFLLHERDGRIAASCWTKIHPGPPPVGEIYVISVDPDHQREGLGRAIVLAGLAHLHAAGIRSAMLYVDAANAAARALYGGLGFSTDHVERSYLR